MYNMYNIIEGLCDSKGIKVGKMCADLEISRGILGDLKAGRTKSLSAQNLEKISGYFGVSSDFILGKEKAPTQEGERIPHKNKRELLAGRGVSILLDADAKLTEDQLDDIVSFIQFQQEKNGR